MGGIGILLALLLQAPAASPVEGGLSGWARGTAMVGGVLLAATLDDEARDLVQRNRSFSGDVLAENVRVLGRPSVYLPVAVSWLALGVVGSDPGVRASGVRVAGTVLAAGLVTRGLKYGVGRARPSLGMGNTSFDAFSNRTSFPSGHTTMAFALAAAISHEAGHPGVATLCYGLAGLTAWSRLNDDNHWLSDTAAGVVLGVGVARLVQRAWYRLGPAPQPVFTPEGVALALRWPF